MLSFIQKDPFKLYVISHQDIEEKAAQPQDCTLNSPREKLYYFLKFKECEGAAIAKKHFSLPLSQIMHQQKHKAYCLHIVQCQAAIQRTDSWVCLLTSSHLAPRFSHTLQGQRRNSHPKFSPPSCRQCRKWSLSHLSCPGYQIQIVRTLGTLI